MNLTRFGVANYKIIIEQYLMLTIWTNIFTILGAIVTVIGVLTAWKIYYSWKRDYKLQKSHEYALDLLKKMKRLHFYIELFRAPSFIQTQTKKRLMNSLRNTISRIEEKIFEEVFAEIEVDLLMAKYALVKNKDLQSHFYQKIKKEILDEIRTAIIEFRYKFNGAEEAEYDEVKKTRFFKIIAPSEDPAFSPWKKSGLGTETDVIDNEFSKKVEQNFNNIYEKIEENMLHEEGSTN